MAYQGSTLQEQPLQKSFSQTKGQIYTRSWKGAQADVDAKYRELINNGYECRISQGPLWTVEANVPDPEEVPTYSWEIIGEKVQTALINSDIPAALCVTADNRITMKVALLNPDKHIKATAAFTGTATDILNAVNLWYIMKFGVTKATKFLPVLKRSYTVSTDYQITDSVSYVNRVHRTETLIAQEQIPQRLCRYDVWCG